MVHAQIMQENLIDIDILDEEELSVTEFRSFYMKPNRPCVIRGGSLIRKSPAFFDWVDSDAERPDLSKVFQFMSNESKVPVTQQNLANRRQNCSEITVAEFLEFWHDPDRKVLSVTRIFDGAI